MNPNPNPIVVDPMTDADTANIQHGTRYGIDWVYAPIIKRACRCLSYNCPEWGGDQPEVILKPPAWSAKESICVDACIAPAIQMLWDNGIVTCGCCCGHNRTQPSVIIDENANGPRTIALLHGFDGRPWWVKQWQLVTL